MKGLDLRAGSIAFASIGSFGAKAMQSLSGLGVSMLLAHLLTVEEMGAYGVLIGLLGIATIPAHAGIGRFMMRAVARARSHNEKSMVGSLISWGRSSAYIYGLILASPLLFLSLVLNEQQPEVMKIATLLLPAFFATLLIRTDAGALAGLRRTISSQSTDLVRNAVMMVLLALVLALYGRGSLPSACLIFGAGAMSAHLMTRIRLRDIRIPSSWQSLPIWGDAWKSSLPFLAVGSITILLSRMDVVLVGFLSGAEEAGRFHIASQFSGIVLFGLTALQASLTPHFVSLHERREANRLKNLAIKASILSSAAGALLFLVLFFGGEALIEQLYGQAYVEAISIILPLALAHLVHSFGGIFSSLLGATGNEKATLRSVMRSGFIKVLAAPILIALFGGVGAAWSLVLYTSVLAILQARHAWVHILGGASSRHV